MIKKIYQKNYGKWGELVNHNTPQIPVAPSGKVYIDYKLKDYASDTVSINMGWFEDHGAKIDGKTSLGNNIYRITVSVRDNTGFFGVYLSAGGAFFKNGEDIEGINMIGFKKLWTNSSNLLFYNLSNLKYINLSDFSGDKILDMTNMFAGCKSLVENSILILDDFKIDLAVSKGAKREWFTTSRTDWIGGTN